MMKLFRKPRDDRLTYSALNVSTTHIIAKPQPAAKPAEVFLTNSVFPFSPLKKDQRICPVWV